MLLVVSSRRVAHNNLQKIYFWILPSSNVTCFLSQASVTNMDINWCAKTANDLDLPPCYPCDMDGAGSKMPCMSACDLISNNVSPIVEKPDHTYISFLNLRTNLILSNMFKQSYMRLLSMPISSDKFDNLISVESGTSL